MMSQARFKQVFSGLPSNAQKVYDFVPLQEVWTASAIYDAVRRAGMSQSYEVVHGCLGTLAKAGLAKESKLGYVREPVRKSPKKVELQDLKTALQEQPATAPAPKTEAKIEVETKKEETMPLNPTQQTNIVDTIGNLAQRMQAMALRHQQEKAELAERHAQEMKEMKDLADLVSDSAIEVQAQFEKNEEDLVKYRQLQQILKGM